ncbi:MAG: nucleoside-diphosphate sugar epimerase/dehydratase [Thermodesulfobacteriota bacterium]
MFNNLVRGVLLNRFVAFFHDLSAIPFALATAFWFRYNFESVPNWQVFLQIVSVALPVQGVMFWLTGLYRGMWRFASMQDLIRILKSVLLGTMLVMLVLFLATRLDGIPRSVILLYPVLLIGILSGSRLSYRWFKDRRFFFQDKDSQKVLVVGAGQGGELLVRDLLRHPEYEPVALVDDDPVKNGREIHGIRILGTMDDITALVEMLGVNLVLIAIPSAPQNIFKQVASICSEVGVECRTLPAITDLDDQDVAVSQLRSLTLEDLLGRDQVKLDRESISVFLRARPVLVTGAGGSIGSELCRQVAKEKPSKLIIFDHGEFNIYAIDHELRNAFPDLDIVTVLGDVKNYERVDWVFKKFRPQVVFHAAAYKHVPMIELNPAEGVVNNVIGSRIVADATDRYGADAFVFVSTDKAVNPANVMGTTKRIAEIYCQNLAKRSETRFITTRFGNVLGSAGSVVPLFEKQIHDGGPVTVTHKEITRYFMTIPEAVSLILQAGAMGEGGEIFVLDMGESVRIRDLAEQMIRLSGLTPGKDIDIVYTGLRPGEKLFEELLHKSENLRGTQHPKLFLAGSRKVDWQWLEDELEELKGAATSRDVERLIGHLRRIVPEYEGPHLSDVSEEAPQALKLVGAKK